MGSSLFTRDDFISFRNSLELSSALVIRGYSIEVSHVAQIKDSALNLIVMLATAFCSNTKNVSSILTIIS